MTGRGVGKLAVAQHPNLHTLLSPCILLILPLSGQATTSSPLAPGCVKTGWMQLTERYANRFHLYQRIFTSTYEISHAVKSPSLTRSPLGSDRFKRKLFLQRCPSPIIVPDLSDQLRLVDP
uniref:Uncharacterized protein n=1 Tax=Pseudomonas putida TaxID=303 RepID=Q8VMJ5_PSEPU|nr:hypothetical protein [Pseudomonas putida]